jgi:SmpA / OmlA family
LTSSQSPTRLLRLPAALALGFALLLGLACGVGPSLTPATLEQVKDGMTTAEVKSLLGEPTAVSTHSLPVLGDVTTYEYKTDKADVEIHFRNDQVRVKIGEVRE